MHLNLCIALALGLFVFVVGIESATSNEVSIYYVAIAVIIMATVKNNYECSGWLQICSSTVAIFVHICILLDDV